MNAKSPHDPEAETRNGVGRYEADTAAGGIVSRWPGKPRTELPRAAPGCCHCSTGRHNAYPAKMTGMPRDSKPNNEGAPAANIGFEANASPKYSGLPRSAFFAMCRVGDVFAENDDGWYDGG